MSEEAPFGHATPREAGTRVSVVDVNMPFGSMVIFMVKWAIASIPALLILAILGFFVTALFVGLFAGLGRH